MSENETPDMQPTMQDVASKLDKGADALATAQEQLGGDVTKALARLAAHETDSNAHGGAIGGGASASRSGYGP